MAEIRRQNPAKDDKVFISGLGKWIDISIPLHNNMVHWPDDPPFQKELIQNILQGDHNNLSKITMGSHTGTHVDAPHHFIQDGKDICLMPIDLMIGIARVIEIKDSHHIGPEELEKHQIQPGERVLFKTINSATLWETDTFSKDFVALSKEAAEFLAKKKIKVAGVDYLSVGGYKSDGTFIHRTLLVQGIWLIEGLNLSRVKPGKYFLICLPLKIVSGDGSPARAIISPI